MISPNPNPNLFGSPRPTQLSTGNSVQVGVQTNIELFEPIVKSPEELRKFLIGKTGNYGITYAKFSKSSDETFKREMVKYIASLRFNDARSESEFKIMYNLPESVAVKKTDEALLEEAYRKVVQNN